MLTIRDKIRLRAKDTEFNSPDKLIRFAISSKILKNPFTDCDRENKCIFIHIPKSAGKSVRRALFATESYHIPAVRYQAADPVCFEAYFKFSFVRNPWHRCLSAYEYLKKRCSSDMSFPDHRWAASNLTNVNSFSDFLVSLENPNIRKSIKRYIHFRDQIDWISSPGKKRKILVDFVGRYEEISKDYTEICRTLGLTVHPPLPPGNSKSHDQDYRRIYTSQMVDLVQDIYRTDIETFGYEFE
ncbi:sulfotransferase family protein [Martelella mediterranea]|uniref:sulfotransferase family 2 domain-containing protein n=1 Tax=Martelella mediterranea TaxID=293089 RepID=UPI001E59D3BF|nr:sulfotransferase family 2 domain-containing protein [Martelella mediterranea]MCD1636366.1 sulfotransferase family protein [Martelella mediterranea]